MFTISEKANKELDKAQKALRNALDALTLSTAYNMPSDIFHEATEKDVNAIITAINAIRGDM
jgi:uncharacterized protein (UPF0332 family)